MSRITFAWKCPVCKMLQWKEPHRSLSDHMEVAHNMVWSDIREEFIESIGVEVEKPEDNPYRDSGNAD